jgi:hypothetical protein
MCARDLYLGQGLIDGNRFHLVATFETFFFSSQLTFIGIHNHPDHKRARDGRKCDKFHLELSD